MEYKIIPVVDEYNVVEHWEIYKGKEFIISCDDNELNETLANLN